MHASPTFLVRLDGHVVVGLVARPVDDREVVQRLHLHGEHRSLASGVVVLEGGHPAAAVPAQLLAGHVEDDPRELPVHDEVRVQQYEALGVRSIDAKNCPKLASKGSLHGKDKCEKCLHVYRVSH